MSGCGRFEELIEKYVAGDIEAADLEALCDHAESCPACARLMELHDNLLEIPGQVAYASDERFDEMRASVLNRIGSNVVQQDSRQPFWKRWLPAFQPRFTRRPVYAIASAVILLALGFAAGRLSTVWPAVRWLSSVRVGSDDAQFVREVVRQASQERGLEGYWDSPFTYSNVSFRTRDDGTVAIDFDVTRHVSVTRKLESPMTREILVHAMIDPTTMGARLNAMGVASEAMDETMDEKLRETLIFILKNDPSMPVRLKALEILTPHASEADVRDALVTVLSQDPSVQIRLMAVESLARMHADPKLIRSTLGEPRSDSDRAVLQRAAELLGDI